MNFTHLLLTKSNKVGSTATVQSCQDNNHDMVYTAFETTLFWAPFSTEKSQTWTRWVTQNSHGLDSVREPGFKCRVSGSKTCPVLYWLWNQKISHYNSYFGSCGKIRWSGDNSPSHCHDGFSSAQTHAHQHFSTVHSSLLSLLDRGDFNIVFAFLLFLQ